MHVVATAGHVDHGKSTLVRALTGMEPDRWAEEHRRGMTIDLGFAWTVLPSGDRVAFVDVPGHERFVANMLAGVGSVPAVLFVVAADEGWMPQSAEHLDALAALGVRHGLLAVTRSDLADPGPATARAAKEIARTSLGEVESVAVSGATGAGLRDLQSALGRLVRGLPSPDPDADVRLWIDRAFTIRGAGTVVTGTLGGGRLRVGEELLLAPAMRPVRVRGLQSLGEVAREVTGVSRVAVNLRGVGVDEVRRGHALLASGRWLACTETDIRLRGAAAADLPATCLLHIGSAQVAVRIRPLGHDTARLTLSTAVPLRIGDPALLRDAGRHRIAAGLTVLDVRPPPLRRRGAAAARAAELAAMHGRPDAAAELRRRRIVRTSDLAAMGAGSAGVPAVGDWAVEPAHWAVLRERLFAVVSDYRVGHPLEHGLPVEAARHRLDLPDLRLVHALVEAPLGIADGRITAGTPALPPSIEAAVGAVLRDLADRPYSAPEAHRLAELGLGHRELAAAARAGALARIADGVYLLPAAVDGAGEVLAGLPQPFTVSAARAALGTTRRVAVPLLELLDARGRTERLPDNRRRLVE
ncbi:MAG: selenocysteine-specific translation elongation factor [Pseudonocardiales bacterium]|nr:MAG: selenocysteine-specific translation elongation factor [Pseudonocardiales bacterium]